MTQRDANFWSGKRVLLTGHTGFKGAWLAIWLKRFGANVTGVALCPNTAPNLFDLSCMSNHLTSHICDIRDTSNLANIIADASPEIVFHLAAQPLVRASYDDPLTTYTTNVIGTANLLDALCKLDAIKVAVMVTTDKVYRNNEWLFPYRESDALGGHDPYSASKAASEIVVASYRDAYLEKRGVAVATARAGNVIGGGDWSQDRLIPDAVRAWQTAIPLTIRNAQAIRPWQHVLEPLYGYLTLARMLWQKPELAGAYNFGPSTHEVATVGEVIKQACITFGRGEVIYGDIKMGPHEAGRLSLEIAKARDTLGFNPKWSLAESIHRTIRWYQAQQQGSDVRSLCEADIDAYEAVL